MSLENMVTAMSCLVSMCGENTTPALMKNSVATHPLDDLWGEGCKNRALDFNKKLAQLQQSQQKAIDTLNSIEKSLNNLKALSAQNGEVKRSRREVINDFDALAQRRYFCNGTITGLGTLQNTADLPTFAVECENKSYGDDWLLIAALDAAHRKSFGLKSEFELVNGFGDLVNTDNVGEYFLGMRRLHAMRISNEMHELLILTNGGKGREVAAITKVNKKLTNIFAIENENKDCELKIHEVYEGDVIDLLQSSLGVAFSIDKLDVSAADRLSIFVKS